MAKNNLREVQSEIGLIGRLFGPEGLSQDKRGSEVKPDISAKQLRKLIEEHRPDLHKRLDKEEFDYLMRLLMPPKDPDPYIDYGSEQKVAKGGKVYGNSTRKSQYKAG